MFQLSQMELQLEQHRTQIRELTRMSHSIAELQELKWGKKVKVQQLDKDKAAEQDKQAKNVNLDLNGGEALDESSVLGAVDQVVKLIPFGGAIEQQDETSRPYSPPWHLTSSPLSHSSKDSDSYRPGMVMEAVDAFLDLREEE